MLSYTDQPRWQTVVGGSEEYVKRFLEVFKGRVHLNSPVTKIRRDGKSINVYVEGHQYSFDKVVIACHADLVLNLLESPTEEEIRHFSPWKYQLNRTFLHKDTSLMPKRKAAWSSWNYIIRDQAVFVTYDMRRLQGLEEDFFVTLNPPYTPNEVLKEIDYHHPIYSKDSVQSQRTLHTLQGRLGTYYCGSYFGYGFHEDAVRSAVTVSEVLN
jgi:predicted NAD/FAD-binding protein